MVETFVPDTVEGVNALLVSREWDRAAVVWAYVHCSDTKGGERWVDAKNSINEKPYTPVTFAAKKFVGLCSKDSVRAHWQRWQDAIDSGHAVPIKPGDPIPTVDLPWKENKAVSKDKGKLGSPPKPSPRREELVDLKQRGKSLNDIAKETGVPKDTARRELERESIARDAYAKGLDDGTVIDWSTLDGSAKVKEERIRKQIRRELQAEFEPAVQAEVQARIGVSFKNAQRMQADAKRVLEARKGVMTRADFNLILACLHPDNSASTEKRGRAFDLFRRSEIVLLDEQENPAVQSLPSMEELLKRRKR